MKFAIVEGVKTLPKPKLVGVCSYCGAKLISKCGEIKVWHWAHYSKMDCDIWWENETEWHRKWKGYFPNNWQEVIHYAEDGEKHIADVKTKYGCILEFQHSAISNVERNSRNSFYPKLVWVVDGMRRKTDKDKFFKAINNGNVVIRSPLLVKVDSDECKIFQEWNANKAVFIDFGEEQRVWWIFSFKAENWTYVVPISKQYFVDQCNNSDFYQFIKNSYDTYDLFINQKKKSSLNQFPMHSFNNHYRRRFTRRRRWPL